MSVDRNIAVLIYSLHGERREWRIGASFDRSTEESLRAHLARWVPAAEWVGVRWETRSGPAGPGEGAGNHERHP